MIQRGWIKQGGIFIIIFAIWMENSKIGQEGLGKNFITLFTKKMNKELLIKVLENVLTIDGKGRPAKARQLLQLLQETNVIILLDALKEIGERKWF